MRIFEKTYVVDIIFSTVFIHLLSLLVKDLLSFCWFILLQYDIVEHVRVRFTFYVLVS